MRSADPQVARNDEASRCKLVPEASPERLPDLPTTWSPASDLPFSVVITAESWHRQRARRWAFSYLPQRER